VTAEDDGRLAQQAVVPGAEAVLDDAHQVGCGSNSHKHNGVCTAMIVMVARDRSAEHCGSFVSGCTALQRWHAARQASINAQKLGTPLVPSVV
jgi:hypothetical protein